MELSALLARGGVWYNVPGKTSSDFIEALVSVIKLPSGVKREDLSQACLRREASSPTAMGQGVAFPHPGEPLAANDDEAFVAVAYPRFPVDWKAPDDEPVRAVFLIYSASRNAHLITLSALAKLCGDEKFHAALRAEAPLEVLVGLLRKKPTLA